MSRFSPETAGHFYGEHKDKPFFGDLMGFITSDVVVGMELVHENSIEKWRNVIGPTNSTTAKQQAPNSLRGLFGTDGTKNAVHGSDSKGSMKKETNFFFNNDPRTRKMNTTAVINNCSLLLIKPHIVKSGQAG